MAYNHEIIVFTLPVFKKPQQIVMFVLLENFRDLLSSLKKSPNKKVFAPSPETISSYWLTLQHQKTEDSSSKHKKSEHKALVDRKKWKLKTRIQTKL